MGASGEAGHRFVVGVDVGGSHMEAAVLGQAGLVAARRAVRFAVEPDADRSLSRLFGLLDEAFGTVGTGRIESVALGVPSIVEHQTGIARWAPALGWHDLPLRAALEERYGVPVVIENDVNLAVVAEHRLGAGRGTRDLVCILVGTNIGGGLILNGELFRGAHGSAGEVGMMIPDPALFGEEWGLNGCLESFAGGDGVARQARLLAGADSPVLAAAGHREAISAAHVFEAARRGDTGARRLVQRVVDYLSLGIVNTIVLVDPELVILGGGVMAARDLLLEGIMANVRRVVLTVPRFAMAVFEDDAVLVGALASAAEAAGWRPETVRVSLEKELERG